MTFPLGSKTPDAVARLSEVYCRPRWTYWHWGMANVNRLSEVKAGMGRAVVVFGLILGLAPLSIRAAEQPTPDVAVLEWAATNANCRGSQLDVESSPQCKRRDELTVALRKKGYQLTNHDVWVSPDQKRYFDAVVLKAGMQAGANPGFGESIMEGMLPELRAKMKDEQIFAIWNDSSNRVALQRQSPYGYPLMSNLMQKLAQYYSKSRNPALTLDNE